MKFVSTCFLCFLCWTLRAQEWYRQPDEVTTRWYSFENRSAAKGAGGQENLQAKGHAFDRVKAGSSVVLMETSDAGIVNRIWMTVSDRSPKALRSLRIEMYWDGAAKPAVAAPLGDFFGVGLGKKVPFENALFSDPEGRSFNCRIPMPYRKGAKVLLVNESDEDVVVFYDINVTTVARHPEDVLYFHTYWHRELQTELGKDYELLPEIRGRGRFLGINAGIVTNESYKQSWWGEGEVKMYIDGDSGYPSLVGTGTEDYIGTAWGQGVFNHEFQGCLVADTASRSYAFYRYHIPDPVYFYRDIRVTIQQMGGWGKEKVQAMIREGANLIPVTVDGPAGFIRLLGPGNHLDINDPEFPGGWVNFYRQDDVSSTAYFYLDRPESSLPGLAPVDLRTKKMAEKQ